LSPAGLRARLEGEELLVAPGAIDPLTARIVERLDFDAVYLGGHSMGIHLGRGQPMTTMTEAIEIASRVVAAVDSPVILDGGAGFGDPVHVVRLVRECERVGVAAVHIEDQPYPKRPGYHRGRGELAPIEVTLAKLVAAVDGRRGNELMIIARTDALRVTGSLEHAIERCQAFAAAGADALMVLDLEPDTLTTINDRLPDLPLAWIGAVDGPGPTLAEIGAAGFSLALYPFNTVAAIIDAVSATWTALRERGQLEQTQEMLLEARTQALELAGIRELWEIDERLGGAGGGEDAER
jgi:2-methylisocitrate lyase-like PEP mutase family enzyme